MLFCRRWGYLLLDCKVDLLCQWIDVGRYSFTSVMGDTTLHLSSPCGGKGYHPTLAETCEEGERKSSLIRGQRLKAQVYQKSQLRDSHLSLYFILRITTRYQYHHSLNKYWLNIYLSSNCSRRWRYYSEQTNDLSGTVLGTGDITVNKPTITLIFTELTAR